MAELGCAGTFWRWSQSDGVRSPWGQALELCLFSCRFLETVTWAVFFTKRFSHDCLNKGPKAQEQETTETMETEPTQTFLFLGWVVEGWFFSSIFFSGQLAQTPQYLGPGQFSATLSGRSPSYTRESLCKPTRLYKVMVLTSINIKISQLNSDFDLEIHPTVITF